MKKLFTLVLLSVCALIFVGCGPAEEPVDYDHTIVFYSTQGDKLQQKTAIAITAFEKKYPGWTVLHQTIGGYDDVKEKVIGDLQAKVQPDLAYCYPDNVALYLQTSKVVDMSTLIASGEQNVKVLNEADEWVDKSVVIGYTAEEIADFVPGYYAEGLATNFAKYEDYGYESTAMLTLPFVKSTELLYYNKTALDKCGLPVATTWDELWEQAPTLSKKFPTATVLGYDSEANWFITMCEQNGWGYTSAEGNHYTFNNPQTTAWLQQLNEYFNEGYIVTQEQYGSYTSNLFTKGQDDGGLIYCVGSSGGASYQATTKFEWGVAPIPGSKQADDTVNYSVISQGPSLVMLESEQVSSPEVTEEKKLMTFLFIKELLDPMFQAAFSIESGYNSCRISTAEVDAYVKHLEGTSITAVAAQVTSSLSDRFFTSPAFIGSSTARTQVGNALVFALTGEKSPEKALRDAYSNCGGK